MVTLEGMPIGVDARQVRLHTVQAQARVGHDLVPVRHQVGLGHGRASGQVGFGDRVGVEVGEAPPVPR